MDSHAPQSPPPPFSPKIEDGFFLGVVLLVSVAFFLVIQPFLAAILWGVIAAILFAPVYRNILAAIPTHQNAAALITLFLILVIVIVPAFVLGAALLQEAAHFYGKIQSGEIDFARLFSQAMASLPEWTRPYLGRIGLSNFDAAQAMLTKGITSSFRMLAAQAFQIGQSAFSFFMALGVMLYLSYFLLRDGEKLSQRIAVAAPLRASQRQALIQQFVIVIRATIKGSLVVAIVQGLIGGIVFWALGIQGALLWGVLMGAFSLLPAIGTAIVWVPVAIFLFASGAIWKAIILVACGVMIIGMVDNVLRPILVGRDTRIPDYVVLITTLGGIELFGFNGIVIGPVIAALFIATWNIFTRMRLTGSGAAG
ncbi:putative PurR-regulated permease PerM [Sphingobium xenophagum]|uniref:PurR-regulated permease PerM n=1 Tax=Sphingobium xenophagum TaxID=121428 RepID=A0ABU1X411_SPHXE|nr:AI-2E family transporter [Sphingobium xenophagum]MDR7156009.1 putative PurR-regulated permease PerM [Sphingobium xenophagum]